MSASSARGGVPRRSRPLAAAAAPSLASCRSKGQSAWLSARSARLPIWPFSCQRCAPLSKVALSACPSPCGVECELRHRHAMGVAAAPVAIGQLGIAQRSGWPAAGAAAHCRRRMGRACWRRRRGPWPSCRRRCGRFRAAGPHRRRRRWQCPPGPAAVATSAMSKRACCTTSMSLRVPQGALPSTTSSAATPMRGSSRMDSGPRTAKSRPVVLRTCSDSIAARRSGGKAWFSAT